MRQQFNYVKLQQHKPAKSRLFRFSSSQAEMNFIILIAFLLQLSVCTQLCAIMRERLQLFSESESFKWQTIHVKDSFSPFSYARKNFVFEGFFLFLLCTTATCRPHSMASIFGGERLEAGKNQKLSRVDEKKKF
jgi:hypothetical protein